ncbi:MULTISPECIES: helix-turn-helix domain-containing protein [unclassified Pseudomonas]|uniref:helix-turn-helix domain-containing protein n=1 Tax=unclassified Pseudomonas TaxID=196821 RepID=UPI001CBF015F|nr:helix-turn-helix transcriptional regulator [Pseudomonas sp. A-B-26]
MPKAIYRTEYDVFQALLKARRINAGLTQLECSRALGRPQSFISDVERGTRRLDIIQIHDLCKVLGCDLVELIQDFVGGIESAR